MAPIPFVIPKRTGFNLIASSEQFSPQLDARLVKVVHIITSLGQGGAEHMLVRLLEASGAPERYHVVSLGDDGYYGGRLRANGTAVTCLKMRSSLSPLLALPRLVALLRRLRPDIVQTWMYHADLFGGVAARIAGVPRLIWGIRQGALPRPELNRRTAAVARLCAALSKWLPDRIASCSHCAAQVHSAFGYDGQRLVVLPNGFDLARYRPDSKARDDFRFEVGLESVIRVFGMVARFHPMKDHRTLLSAFRIVQNTQPNCRLLLCGQDTGPADDGLRAEVQMLGLNDRVLLLGPRHDIWRVMNGIDVHVLSSAHSEGFPNVLGEAMACGTPCVATDVGDSREIVGDTGWLVSPSNPQELARAMLEAIGETTEQRAARGARCRQRIAERFEIGAVCHRYEELWRELGSVGRAA